MIKKTGHIGIAVENAEETFRSFSSFLGFEKQEELVDEQQGIKSIIIKANDAVLELIESIGPDSTVSKFLNKHGSGIHHISFEVEDLVAVLKVLENKGVVLINKRPLVTKDYKVVFVHPKAFNGVLIELAERIRKT
jgi:methylmalonyl-CoA/ethylmalonyl-CoA epimerase